MYDRTQYCLLWWKMSLVYLVICAELVSTTVLKTFVKE